MIPDEETNFLVQFKLRVSAVRGNVVGDLRRIIMLIGVMGKVEGLK